MKLTATEAMEVQFRFEKRLSNHGVRIFFHTLDSVPLRWEKIRSAITSMGLANTPMHKGTNETYSQGFDRASGEPLTRSKAAA